jgi:hypothetical protein
MGVLLNENLDVLANEKSSVLLNLKLNFEIGYFPFWATNISYHLLSGGMNTCVIKNMLKV